ncbi:hypothetical protein CBL_21374, partial [Carabus blaptoides fortunei]
MSEGTGSRAVQNFIAAAVSALNVGEDDFERVVNRTRRSFRPKSRSTPKRKTKWKKKIILLRSANADFCPSAAEIKYLTDCGLGYSLEAPAIELHWTFDELETYIFSVYPDAPLEVTGFNFAKLNRQRKIFKIDIENPFNIESLKEK